MDILSNLTELLKTRKEVGINGVGTISKRKSPGRYDTETHSFLPPVHLLEFTTDIRENTALAGIISQKKNISVDSATYYADQFAEELLKQLDETGMADLGELGKLVKLDGKVNYIPPAEPGFGFDFYGFPVLKDLVRPPAEEALESPGLPDAGTGIAEAAESEATETTSLPVPEISGHASDDEQINAENEQRNDIEVLNEVHEPEADHEYFHLTETTGEKTGWPVYASVIIGIVILVAAAAAAYFIKPELFGLNREDRAAVPELKAPATGTDSLAAGDSLPAQTRDTLGADSAGKDSLAVAAAPLHADTATTWEVIGASVITQKEVTQVIADMKARGIEAKVIPTMPGKRRIKISIATFYDEVSARAGRKELVEKLKNPELYIYQNKHTKKRK